MSSLRLVIYAIIQFIFIAKEILELECKEGTVVEEVVKGVILVEFNDDQGQTYAMVPLRTDQLMYLHYAPVAA